MSSQRFPGTGSRLGGPSLPQVPVAPSPQPAPSPAARTPSPASPPNLSVVNNSRGVVLDNESGKFNQGYGAHVTAREDRVESQKLNLSVADHSSQHHIFNAGGSYNSHHGPILGGDYTPTSSLSRSSSTASSSSNRSSYNHPTEFRDVNGRRESPVVRGSSGRSKRECSSVVASVYSEDHFIPLPDALQRPNNPIGASDSTDSLAQIMNTLRSKLGEDWEHDDSHESPRPGSSNSIKPEYLFPTTQPLHPARIRDSWQKRDSAVTASDNEPVIPPRRPRGDQASITTTSSSPSRRSRSPSPSRSSTSSGSGEEGHDSDEDDHGPPLGPRTASPEPIEKSQPSRPINEPEPETTPTIPPSQSVVQPTPSAQTKEQQIPPKQGPIYDEPVKERKAGCCSACVIC